MKSTNIIIVSVAVVAVAIFAAGAYILFNDGLNVGLSTVEHRQDITTHNSTANIELEAYTFNGKIEIQPTTSEVVEVIYDIQAPTGQQLYEVVTGSNGTITDGTLRLIAKAEVNNPDGSVSANQKADILIKVPSTSTYNLTLQTLNGNIIKPLLNSTNIKASTLNGDVNIEDAKSTLIDASTLNGNVNIQLQQGTLFHVEATTSNGHFKHDGISLIQTVDATQHIGNTQAGAGTLILNLTSLNGDITISYTP